MDNDFIKLISEIHEQRYSRKIQNLINNKTPCGFLCGFYIPDNLSNVVNYLVSIGVNLNCLCITSDIQDLQASIPIIQIENLEQSEFKPEVLFYIDNIFHAQFSEYCVRQGIKRLIFANYSTSEYLYDYFIQNLSTIYSVYKMLENEESKRVFEAAIKGRLTLNLEDFEYAPEPQYFLKGFFPKKGDIAIDGGAYDGATARDFSIQGAKVYAFEMSAENYQNCLERAKKYHFTIENFGLSNSEGESFYIESGAGSRKGGNTGPVAKFIDLDTYVERKNLPRVDYIKLDIEGAELDMLHGAVKTISRWKPKMAISAYHKPEDLWTLATYVKSIRPDYKFQFRHYRTDCTNYVLTAAQRDILKKLNLSCLIPCIGEMVLYCK